MNMSNLTECVPIGELKLEEKPETTFTTITNVDNISNLPDSLLCHILSFLPTRTSVATSVLSRRWRHLWKDLNVLDLADESLLQPYYQVPREDAEHDFVNFVGNFLHQVRHIHKFRLSCDILYHRDALEDWINAVTGPYLQELYLRLSCRFSNQLGIYVLPHAIFTCTSLVSLTLERDIFVEKLQSVHLPSLKNLKLEVIYANLDKILSGCPSLETLNATSLLGWSNGEGPRPGSLHMPHSLKSLTFVEVDGNGAVAVKHLVIDTPSLEYLDITLSAPYLGVLVSNFPNMMEARVDVFIEDEHVDWVPKVLKALCKTRMLLLTCSTMLCLLRAPAPEIPEFSSLLRLEIEFPIFSSRFLLGMLHNCHRLQVLMIQNNGVKSSEVSSDWPVPNCVISHLNIVEFRGYQDSVEEHEFTAYILQKGLVLKTMTIHTCPYRGFDQEEKDRILMEVSTIPRGSSICQLKLD